MRVLLWHVHGSYATALVQGDHEYLVPVVAGRGPDGRGRARTWDWPDTAREITPEELRDAPVDVVILQRVHEIDLVRSWARREPGSDLPAVFLEHDAPTGQAAGTPHPLGDQARIPVVHVTHFNALMWDCGQAPVSVVEHGVPDPGRRYTGERASLGVAVNEPARRGRVAGTDLLLRLARELPIDVYGMGMRALGELAVAGDPGDGRTAALAGRLHDDLPQDAMHTALARHRAYLHPFRWTSLGLALIEAMLLGLPVLGLSTTAAPESVPAGAGVLSNDLQLLADTARRWLADPDEARERGAIGRAHALERFGMDRFLRDWDTVLTAVTARVGA